LGMMAEAKYKREVESAMARNEQEGARGVDDAMRMEQEAGVVGARWNGQWRQ